MQAPLVFCSEPGCVTRVYRGRCEAHTPTESVESGRPNVDVRRWYRTARWFRMRAVVLRAARYTCASCGAVSSRLDVDHIERHDGDPYLFWDPGNVQALCSTCHRHKTLAGR